MVFFPQEIIRTKRDGGELSKEEIEFLVSGFVKNEIPDYQMSAWLMSIFCKGFSSKETVYLLHSMMRSGVQYNWKHTGKIAVDKHSTGGVGDKTSLAILPLLVCDGLINPMVAGRGLGHTGGTLDKLESLPGFVTQLGDGVFKNQVQHLGAAFGAQTNEFVPADKKLYALRDVTATVESQALIVASIMSKKLAEGLDALVLDVKFGSGSFMGSLERAKELAAKLVAVGKEAGCKVTAALTNMDEPLGRSAGNACEVAECLDVLQGAGALDTRELSLQLAGRVAALAKLDANASREKIDDESAKCYLRMKDHLMSGRAFEVFCKISVAQGAKMSDLERTTRNWLEEGSIEVPIYANQNEVATNAVVAEIKTRNMGLALISMGAGRLQKEHKIVPTVGLNFIKKVGESIQKNEPLCLARLQPSHNTPEMKKRIADCFVIGTEKTNSIPLIQEWL